MPFSLQQTGKSSFFLYLNHYLLAEDCVRYFLAYFKYEDELEPYLSVTRKLYKDLISVVKDSATGLLKVSSLVYKIVNVQSSVSPLFPLQHPQNFCYLAIDPLRRNVTLFYHASDAYY